MKINHRKIFRVAVNAMLAAGLACGSGLVLADNSDESEDAAQTPAKSEAAKSTASSGGGSLAEKATNPTSFLMQLRLQDAYTTSYRNADSYGNAALFQGVFPTKLGWGKAAEIMINRVTLPYVTTPKIEGVSDDGRSVGMGDMLINTWLVAPLGKGKTMAWGATFTVPTAGDNEFTGAGSWQAGPTMAFVNTNTPTWQWGGMFYQQWSFNKTRESAKNVSILSLQPIITKHFNHGWYISAPDTPSSYNFKTKQWTVNVGAAVGKITKWGPAPIQLFFETYYNVVGYDDTPSGKLTLKFNLGFLFPE